MNAFLVGADRLGNIPETLASAGFTVAGHVSGRDAAHQRKGMLPAGIHLVVLFTDFLGHNVMRRFREAARAQRVRIVACRRSVTSLNRALAQSRGSG